VELDPKLKWDQVLIQRSGGYASKIAKIVNNARYPYPLS
jgi:hypothetical protein